MKYLLIISVLITTMSINAEVITDGTLGQKINLPGSDFQITSDLGQQHGGNLFHSFQDFNLNSLESATFSGSNNVQNIISRVTGGNPSNIDGLIRSTIPNADFYFLNPYGIMFGSNAQLDVQGSFHVSTADYLRLGNKGRFNARNPSDSLLTIAPIESFGFLSTSQTKLTINNSSLSTDETLSIISNNIDINQAKLTAKHLNLISATGAVLIEDLTVVDKLGDINIQNSQFESNTIELKANNISLRNGTIINASGDGANINLHAGDSILAIGENTELIATALKIESGKDANITLTAKQIIFQDGAYIFSKTSDNNDGSDITLNAKSVLFTGSGSQSAGFPTTIKSTTVSKQDDAGKSGDLVINAENIAVKDNGYFYVTTDGTGQGGDMIFKADNFQLEDAVIIIDTTNNGDAGTIKFDITEDIDAKAGSIYNFTFPPFVGNAGKIIVNAKNINLENGSYLMSNSFGIGRAGDITVNVQETIKISGANSEAGWGSLIGSSSNVKIPSILGGDAGNIIITANNLLLEDGGQITSSSIAPKDMQSGKGGVINIDVQNIEITGVNQYGETEDGFSSGIYARSIGVEDNAGNGGEIFLQADSLTIADGGIIISSTNNYANSGEIEIIVKNDINISGDSK
ncbi:MAG: filamentous hemagglutinin N-terminal domain-containing protein [Candidatus Marithrix sp.]